MMRAELAKSIERMRTLRREVFAEKKLDEEKKELYREQLVIAASYVDRLEDKAKVRMLKERIRSIYSGDPAFERYDSTQNMWWRECEEGPEFLATLQMLSAYYLRSTLSGPEDVFHVLQIVKYLHERDKRERKKDSFVLPTYGGLPLPAEYLGALLFSMTGNPYLVPIETEDNMVLSLDWYPDDSRKGRNEVRSLLNAAQRLGFLGIEFRLAPECEYSELYRIHNVFAKTTQDGWKATIPCPTFQQNESPQLRLFRSYELGETTLEESQPTKPEGKEHTLLYWDKEGMKCTVYFDSLGSAARLLFAAQKDMQHVSGGLYFQRKQDSIDMNIETIQILTQATAAIIMLRDVVPTEHEINVLIRNQSNYLLHKGFNRQLAYAVITDKESRQETEMEAIEVVSDEKC